MSSTNKSALKLGAERSIVQASNIGMLQAARQVSDAERRAVRVADTSDDRPASTASSMNARRTSASIGTT
jgi:hypothetical protein